MGWSMGGAWGTQTETCCVSTTTSMTGRWGISVIAGSRGRKPGEIESDDRRGSQRSSRRSQTTTLVTASTGTTNPSDRAAIAASEHLS